MVKNILLLDSEGKRVAVKYYSDDWPTNGSKLAFEKALFAKTMKSNARTEGLFRKIEIHVICTVIFPLICKHANMSHTKRKRTRIHQLFMAVNRNCSN